MQHFPFFDFSALVFVHSLENFLKGLISHVWLELFDKILGLLFVKRATFVEIKLAPK